MSTNTITIRVIREEEVRVRVRPDGSVDTIMDQLCARFAGDPRRVLCITSSDGAMFTSGSFAQDLLGKEGLTLIL